MGATTIIALCISGLMFLLSLVTFIVNLVINGKKKITNDENRLNDINQSLIKVNMKLDQVCSTTSNIQSDIRVMQAKQIEHTGQIVALETRMNAAFEKIDELRHDLSALKGVEFPRK